MQKLEPQGAMLIVYPIPVDETITQGGIIAQEFNLSKGEILEVSKEWGDRYNVGDIILFPEGAGKTVHYQRKACLWVDGRAFTDNGDVFAIVINESTKKND